MYLSRFHKVKKIGRGGISIVWKVKNKTDSKVFAMKEMNKRRVVLNEAVSAVLNERRILSFLKHPLISNMHYAFQTRENLYLVVDYMKGGDLRYTLGNTISFSEAQIKFFICCILCAIEYVHKNGIIHGDIKPENLVFDDKGYLKLADFGRARMQVANNALETAGTPQYMAPEILFMRNHDISSDYYSIGVVLFELITRKRPYIGNTRDEIKAAVTAGLPRLEAPGWSKEAIDLTYKLLKTNPEQRIGYNGPQEVKEHAWFKGVDWNALLKGKINAPYVPKDTDNFYKGHVHKDFRTNIRSQTYQGHRLFVEYAYNKNS